MTQPNKHDFGSPTLGLHAVGLGAAELAERLRNEPGPLELIVVRTSLRSTGKKRGPPIDALNNVRIRHLTQCLLLYPQDAELQIAVFDYIKRQASGRSFSPASSCQIFQKVLLRSISCTSHHMHAHFICNGNHYLPLCYARPAQLEEMALTVCAPWTPQLLLSSHLLRAELLVEVQSSAVLPVVINAMEASSPSHTVHSS